MARALFCDAFWHTVKGQENTETDFMSGFSLNTRPQGNRREPISVLALHSPMLSGNAKKYRGHHDEHHISRSKRIAAAPLMVCVGLLAQYKT